MTWLPRGALVATARVLVLLGVLLAPWPGVGRAFTAACAAPANVVLHRVHVSDVDLDVTPAAENLAATGGSPWFAVLTVRNTPTGVATRSALNVRALAYVPFAVLLALSLGAPVQRAAVRVPAAVAGLVFVSLYVLIASVAPVALLLDEPRIQAISLGEFGRRIVATVFTATAETSVEAPVLLWLLGRWCGDLWADRVATKSVRSPQRPSRSANLGVPRARGARRAR